MYFQVHFHMSFPAHFHWNAIEHIQIITFSFKIEATLGHLVFLNKFWKLWSQVLTGNISSKDKLMHFLFNTSQNRNLNNTKKNPVGCSLRLRMPIWPK